MTSVSSHFAFRCLEEPPFLLFSSPSKEKTPFPFCFLHNKPSFYFYSRFLFLYAAAVNSSPPRDALLLPPCCILSPDRTDALCYWTETMARKSCRYSFFFFFFSSIDSSQSYSRAARVTCWCLAWKSVPVGVSDDGAEEKTLFIHGDELMPHACFVKQFSSSVTFTQSGSSAGRSCSVRVVGLNACTFILVVTINCVLSRYINLNVSVASAVFLYVTRFQSLPSVFWFTVLSETTVISSHDIIFGHFTGSLSHVLNLCLNERLLRICVLLPPNPSWRSHNAAKQNPCTPNSTYCS